ncbi:unnamed protein product [Symbiodinium sp. CCMP2592]|nr:unnamed protein product [Symbiodinium sp. CCMP2592]
MGEKAYGRSGFLSLGMLLWSCCRRRHAMTLATQDTGAKPTAGTGGSGRAAGSHWKSAACDAKLGRLSSPWITYLFYSPTRSSIVGVAQRDDVERDLQWHNGAAPEREAPTETQLLRPWRIAEFRGFESQRSASAFAWRVSHASGFRARRAAMLADLGDEAGNVTELPLSKALDSLTYAEVEFCHPADSSRCATVLAMVDTGSNDCDLNQAVIDQLRLPFARGHGRTVVETSANKLVEVPIYQAKVRLLGREAVVELNPADADYEARGGGVATPAEDDVDKEFDFAASTDEAVIGADALASLGLIVDCSQRRLIRDDDSELKPWKLEGTPALPRKGSRSHCLHVKLRFRNPAGNGAHKELAVRALVDSGSTDAELKRERIKSLGLAVDETEIPAQFETAGGVTIEAPIYRTIASLADREALVRVSPSEEDLDEEDSEEESEESDGASGSDIDSDDDDDEEALLGHDALAALGLLVDCGKRRLLKAPPPEASSPRLPAEDELRKRRRRKH